MTHNIGNTEKLTDESMPFYSAHDGRDLPNELFHTSPSSCKTTFGTKPTMHRISRPESSDFDPLSKTRQSLVGRFYIRYLKKNKLIRATALWLWQNGYPIFVKCKVRMTKSSHYLRLVTSSEYSEKIRGSVYEIAGSEMVETPPPAVFPSRNNCYLVAPHDRYIFPDIFITTINDALVVGGSNLILLDDSVICHDLYDFSRDYTSEELHGRTVINPNSRRLCWRMYDSHPVSIPVVAHFIDACAYNYAHWMTEVLPRISLFCLDKRFQSIPIVVNDDLHPNLVESLSMVIDERREVFLLPIGRSLRVDKLYSLSPTGYVPFDRRSRKQKVNSHGLFSPHAFKILCERLQSVVSQDNVSNLPKKVYIQRNSNGRNVVNSSEIKSTLVENGFTIIEPERLTFEQQIRYFSNADVVVGGSGAAMANLIFCKPGSRIIILISKYKETSYWYWQNIACAAGHHVKYVLGDICNSSASGIHSDFYINKKDVLDALGDST